MRDPEDRVMSLTLTERTALDRWIQRHPWEYEEELPEYMVALREVRLVWFRVKARSEQEARSLALAGQGEREDDEFERFDESYDGEITEV